VLRPCLCSASIQLKCGCSWCSRTGRQFFLDIQLAYALGTIPFADAANLQLRHRTRPPRT
jgi:hypothetical protein